MPDNTPRFRSVAVCIPARNEAARLPVVIRSLAAQRLTAAAMPLRVVVVANNCTDATLPVLHGLKREHDGTLAIDVVDVTLPPGQANVGYARRLAMDRGADWLERDGCSHGVLLTTDADAAAPTDWVGANLAALQGADLVGGRLRMAVEDDDGETAHAIHARIERYWAAVRALEQAIDPPPHDRDPRHGDHTAASLALSVALYRQVGGLPTLACGEDNALVERVRHAGGRVRHCPHVEIVVSPRRQGRVSGGMADEMRRRATLIAEGGDYRLPAGDHWRRVFERRAAARRAWRDFTAARDQTAFERLDLSVDDLAAIAPTLCPNDIAFVERAEQRYGRRMTATADVVLDVAVAQLDELLCEHAAAAGHSHG